MPELAALKIKISLKVEGARVENDYPNFNDIPPEKRGNMDWSYFFDKHGIGWHYDQVAGHGQSDSESPDPSELLGVIAVPVAFVREAVQRFPDRVERITEAELQRFWEERAHVNEPPEDIDVDRLNALRAKYGVEGVFDSTDIALMEPIDRRALDPDDPMPGIVKNRRRLWTDHKQDRDITITVDAVR